ncbi:MAG: NYN domain-containing protein [Oscillospiraceae bacterium]|nr:NYN domain-containing protein [Oscillospiraceae bacterium]
MPLENLRIAVLIDADNAPRKNVKGIMEEIAIYGTPTIKRIYGDWTTPNLASWKKTLLQNAITPVQQYGYTVGKNSTDSAMIIDAMDILYSGNVDGFCLVSSDSDFTRLATRLREAGMTVIGIGEKKTPEPFIVACDKFIYIEIINAKTKEKAGHQDEEKAPAEKKPAKEDSKAAKETDKPADQKPSGKKKKDQPQEKEQPQEPEKPSIPQQTVELIAASIADIADEDGYAFLGELGSLLLKKQPDFDSRNFGFRKLTPLIASLDRFELDVRTIASSPNTKHIYVRDKLA